MSDIQALFEAVQEACPRPVWSRGVELARAEAVSVESRRKGEIALRVVSGGALVAPEVTLHPDDEDWQCSCASPDDPCEHVAASVIALRQAKKSGADLPTPGRERGRIAYVLEEQGGELTLTRTIEVDGRRTPLRGSLTAVAAGRHDGPGFVATTADVAIERAIASRPADATSGPRLGSLLEPLSRCDRILLGDRPVRIDREPLGLRARVVDAPGGARLFVEQDPRIERAFRNGLVLAGDAIHPLAPNRLTGRELADLPRGRFFADDELATLVTEVLPDLGERIPLAIETRKLPSARRGEKPRLRIEVEREGDGLRVLPTLVYGRPPVARIDAGRLVHLGGGEVPIRDEPAENAAITRLRSELGLRPGIAVRLGASEAIDFATRLADANVEVAGTAHHDFALRGRLEASLEIDDDRLDLTFTLADDATSEGDAGEDASASARHAGASRTADRGGRGRDAGGVGARAEAVIEAWSRGESVVALEGGGFARLPEDWLQRFGDRVADLLGALDARGRVARHALPDLARLCDALEKPPPPSLEGLRPLLEGFETIPHAALPAGLEGVLRDYQRRGVDWLVFLRRAGLGALLADDMGLGKTLQALCAVEGRTLVVAPTSVLHGWVREIERFRPELACALYHGPSRSLDPKADITITSYALLRQDVDRLAKTTWDCVILDEAQAIKNPDSQIARAAFRLDARARVALTGTPVENRLEELWSQLHFLNPGLLGGRTAFRDRYARPIAEGDDTVTVRLRRRIRPFLLRRLKSEVAPELPPLSEIVLDCELSPDERAVYDSVRAATVRDVVERLRGGGNVMAALEALLRLRQAACHAALVPGQDDMEGASSKLETLYARLEEAVADGHKALVFSQWTSLLDRVEPGLAERNIEWLRLDGSTRDRGAVVERFQSEDGPPVMLLSLRAGGTGLNLTAADHVFLLDPWWNPAVEAQAADRAHRIGQERPVVLHRLIARDTVEEGILRLHARKRALADAALEEADGSSRLSRDELIELLESA
ncbi:MAG TPA: DEAD/DEAH box helicase [Myxococcota bacterium]|nr:DEAD/DEAH box helicase [Myxococcota bacterium]